jgi:hypothetical protein
VKRRILPIKRFFSSLKNEGITDQDYQNYLIDHANKKNRLEYLRYYNIRDTVIMNPIIEGLQADFAHCNVDMHRQVSLSANAVQIKYGLA